MNQTFLYWTVTSLCWLYAKLFFRLRVVFPREKASFFEQIRNEPVIIAANHASYLDPPLLGGVWPLPLYFFASKHLFERSSLLSWVLKRLHTYPLKRGHGVSALKEAIRLVSQEGLSVVIFPEGTRSRSGRLQELQDGVSFIAWKSGARIIPVSISGTYGVWPKHARLPRFSGRIVVRFGEPIDPKVLPRENCSSREAIPHITEALSQAIRKLEQQSDRSA